MSPMADFSGLITQKGKWTREPSYVCLKLITAKFASLEAHLEAHAD